MLWHYPDLQTTQVASTSDKKFKPSAQKCSPVFRVTSKTCIVAKYKQVPFLFPRVQASFQYTAEDPSQMACDTLDDDLPFPPG